MLKARLSDRPPAQKKDNNNNSKNKINFSKISFSPFKKNITYILISIFVLLLGLSFIAPMFINLKIWKPEIISVVERYTGKKTSIDGDINFSLYPYPQIFVEKAYIYDNYENNEIFFSSDVIKAQVSIFPLIKGVIKIDKIIIENMNLNMVNYDDDIPNWAFRNSLREESDNTISEYSTFNFPNIKITQYEITGGKLSFVNKENKYSTTINNIILNTQENYDSIAGKIDVNNHELVLNGTISDAQDFVNVTFNISDRNSKFVFDGQIEFENYYPIYKGEFKIDIEDNQILSNLISDNLSNLVSKNLKLESGLEFKFLDKDIVYSLDNISISSGSSIFTGAISGKGGDSPNLDIVLSSNNFNLDLVYENLNSYLEIFSEDKINNSLFMKNLPKVNGSLLLSIGTSKLRDYPVRDIVIDIKKIKDSFNLKNAKAIFPGNTVISMSGDFIENFKVFNGQANLVSENVKLFGSWLSFNFADLSETRFNKGNIKSSVVFRKGGATFAGLSGSLDSSKFEGEVRLRFLEKNSLSANLRIDQINLDAYMGDENNKNSVLKDNSLVDSLDEIVFDIKFDKVSFINNAFEDINFSASLIEKNLNIRKLLVNNFKDGVLNISGDINYLSKKPKYNLLFDYNNNDYNSFTKSLSTHIFAKHIIKGEGKLEGVVRGNRDSLLSQITFENKDILIDYDGKVIYSSFENIIWDGSVSGIINNPNNFFVHMDSDVEDSILGSLDYSMEIYSENSSLKLKNINFKNDVYYYRGNIDVDFEDSAIVEADMNAKELSLNSFIIFNNILTHYISDNIYGKFKIKSDKIVLENNFINNFRGEVNFDNNKIIFQDFKGEAFNSKITKSGSYDKVSKVYEGEIKFSNAELNLMLNNYFINNKIFGDFKSKIVINSFGDGIHEIIKNLNAEGTIVLDDVYLENINILNAIQVNQSIEFDNNYEAKIKDAFLLDKNSFMEIDDFEFSYIGGKFLINSIPIILDEYIALFNLEYAFDKNILIGNLKFDKNQNNKEELLINIFNDEDKIEYSIDSSKKENIQNVTNLINDVENEDGLILENDNLVNNTETNKNLGFEDILNDLSADNLNVNTELLNEDIDNISNSSSEEIVSGAVKNLVINLDFKNIIYDKPANLITNDIVKPQLPTQEEMLDDILDTLLSD